MRINSISDLNKATHLLPIVALQDIDKRISDWIASGGSYDDQYIRQQFRYAEAFINAIK